MSASLGIVCLTLTSCGGGSAAPASTAPTYNAASLSGGYVFTAQGTDPNDGDYYVAGTLQADGKGNITSGAVDYNLGSGIDSNVAVAGTYSVGSTGNGTVTITDSHGVSDTFTIFLASTSASTSPNGVASFDSTGTGSLITSATPPASPAGTYTVTLSGEGAGTVSASASFTTNASGTITAGTETFTDAGTTTNYASLSGFLSPMQNGRGYAVIGPNSFGYYLNAQNQIVLVGLDDWLLLYGTAQKTS